MCEERKREDAKMDARTSRVGGGRRRYYLDYGALLYLVCGFGFSSYAL